MLIEKFKVSIVIPTFNEEKNISKLIESLFLQTYTPNEIIISDGGSTDSTLTIVKNYIAKNNSLKIVNRLGRCRGSGRNEGIKFANNDIIALIDSGMIPEKDWLENLLNNLKKNNLCEVIFGSVHFLAKKNIDKSFSSTFIDKKNKLNYIIPSVASMIIKKSSWKKIGGFPESKDGSYIVEDLIFINKITKYKLIKINDPKSKVYWIMDFKLFRIINRYYEYSIGGLKAGYFSTWHKGLIKNFIILIILLIFSIKISLFFLFFLMFLLIFKSYLYLKFTKWFIKDNLIKKCIYLFQTSLIFFIIDFSSFLGIIRWISLGFPKVKNK